ncbi:hypothetical protein DFO67_10715 [Modicisalibacter xianhensis]|uniref:Uncharacterized protein n=1 Tax=Modicisalibacter xianhensis TaxID=442341 RepID=A0A4R8FRY9_9GAMM|nr:hypothetical protein DFO67_10715 [Halomonas xianhensis]
MLVELPYSSAPWLCKPSILLIEPAYPWQGLPGDPSPGRSVLAKHSFGEMLLNNGEVSHSRQ